MNASWLNLFFQTDVSHLSTFEKETFFIDRIGYVVSRFIAGASLYTCATSSSRLLISASYAAIPLIAYKILSSMRSTPTDNINKKPSSVKLLMKEVFLILYCKVLKIFQRVLKTCGISNDPLDKHYFKIKVLKQYTQVESTRLISQEKFQKFLKVPMLNLPKLEHALAGSYLESAKHYLHEFSEEYTEEKMMALCKNKADDFIEEFSLENPMTPEKKDKMKRDWFDLNLELEKENSVIPAEKDLRPPKSGVCCAAASKIFEKFVKTKKPLEEIAFKYRDGFGKKIAGLQSFYCALSDKRMSSPKSVVFQKEDPEDHMLKRINIKRCKKKKLSLLTQFKSEENLLEMIEKVSQLENGSYSISLSTFDDSDKQGSIVISGTSHKILILKQQDCIQIGDPNIGLLVANEKAEINELIQLVLLHYAKKNKNLYLEAHAFIED